MPALDEIAAQRHVVVEDGHQRRVDFLLAVRPSRLEGLGGDVLEQLVAQFLAPAPQGRHLHHATVAVALDDLRIGASRSSVSWLA
nr:hypothetical protein [Catenulispora pinisilvae]